MDEAQMRHHYGGSGYHVFASDRGPRRGGGAAILVRQLNSLQVGTIDANHVGLIQGVDHVSVRISDSREPEAGLTVTNIFTTKAARATQLPFSNSVAGTT